MPVSCIPDNVSIEWAKDEKEAKCLPPFQILAFSDNVLPDKAIKKFQKGIPYNYFCPSNKDILKRRVYKESGIHFESINSNQQHSAVFQMNESSADDKSIVQDWFGDFLLERAAG